MYYCIRRLLNMSSLFPFRFTLPLFPVCFWFSLFSVSDIFSHDVSPLRNEGNTVPTSSASTPGSTLLASLPVHLSVPFGLFLPFPLRIRLWACGMPQRSLRQNFNTLEVRFLAFSLLFSNSFASGLLPVCMLCISRSPAVFACNRTEAMPQSFPCIGFMMNLICMCASSSL